MKLPQGPPLPRKGKVVAFLGKFFQPGFLGQNLLFLSQSEFDSLFQRIQDPSGLGPLRRRKFPQSRKKLGKASFATEDLDAQGLEVL
jgi:hypothetical protein